MPDEKTPEQDAPEQETTEETTSQDEGQSSTGSDWDGDISTLPSAAQEYIKQLRSEAAERRVQLKKQEEEQRRREQERLAEQGKFKELAESRAAELEKIKPYMERAESLESMIRESNKKRVEQVPESMRALIPSDYAPEKLSAWLDSNWRLLTAPVAPDLDGGAGGTGGRRTPQLTREQKAMARAAGMTEEQYAKALQRAAGRSADG